MKIDFVITSLKNGGGETVLVTIVNNLVNRGHDINLVTFESTMQYELDPKIKLVKLHGGFFKNHTLRYIHELFKYYGKKENKPDTMVSFMTQTSLSCILIAKLLGIKVIASEHTNHLMASSIDKFTRKYVYRFANYVTILTSFDLDYYKKHHVNATILPNPCSFKKIDTSQFVKTKTILAIGGLHKYHVKGFDNLLPIVKPILDTHKDWRLMIVGDSNLGGYDVLKNLVNDLQIEDQVVFAGLQNDVQSIMATSEIFVLSSRNEGLPMVLLEAMFQGMACVAYNCISGPSDIITHGNNGILVENQNHEAMRFHINELIENEELRNRLSKNTSKIISKFNEDYICDKWESLIKDL